MLQNEYQQLSKKQLLAFFAMVVGMFMAVLDIQIVASSLSAIAAGLSASTDELSWIQTSYLIAEVIIIPITGFLIKTFSTRITYFVTALGFTIMSILCSLAWNIEVMILFRSLQGFFGGAMIPTTFSTVFVIFPPKQRATINIVIGLVVTIAPTLGPTLGGYITEILSWHFMFLLNSIPGIFVCITVFLYADFDQPNYNLLKNLDYTGITLMTITLGILQYILEEGNKRGWFEDKTLVLLTIVTLCGFILLIARELTYVNPILDLNAFKNKNFVFGCIYSLIIGMGLYNAVYILPLFLFTITGLNTLQIGITMMVTGVSQFLSAPIVGKMINTGVDIRIMLIIGLNMFAIGCYLNSFLTIESAFWQVFWPQVMRGMSLMFCFLPVSDIALGTIPKPQIPNASGLYNLMRNLGGAVSLAIFSSLLNVYTKTAAQYLQENISLTNNVYWTHFNRMKQLLFSKVLDPEKVSYMLTQNAITKNAFVIAVNEVFIIISLIFVFSMVLIPFIVNVQHEEQSTH